MVTYNVYLGGRNLRPQTIQYLLMCVHTVGWTHLVPQTIHYLLMCVHTVLTSAQQLPNSYSSGFFKHKTYYSNGALPSAQLLSNTCLHVHFVHMVLPSAQNLFTQYIFTHVRAFCVILNAQYIPNIYSCVHP
jgi:hypothetical protein